MGQEQNVSDKNALLYFRMNFYILEALYRRIIQSMKIAYPEITLLRDIDGMDFFYREIMRSNRTDYSKYKNGSCKKTSITSKMERELMNECPQLRRPLMNGELIKPVGIDEKWVCESFGQGDGEEYDPKDIRKYCEKCVAGLANNIVITCKQNAGYKGKDDIDKIAIWIYRIIRDNKVASSNAEAKIKGIIDELTLIKVDEIDKCSVTKLKKYKGDIAKVYKQFEIVYNYKVLKNPIEKKES